MSHPLKAKQPRVKYRLFTSIFIFLDMPSGMATYAQLTFPLNGHEHGVGWHSMGLMLHR